MQKITVYWCRRDFRINDNPAFYQAVQFAKSTNQSLIIVYILDTDILNNTKNIGYARRKYLSKILANIAFQIPNFFIFNSSPSSFFQELSQNYNITVFANDDIEPYAINRDKQVSNLIQANNSNITFCNDILSINKNSVTGTGNLYSVFTPFKNANFDYFLNQSVHEKVNLNDINICDLFFDKAMFSSNNANISKADLANKIFKLIDTSNILTFENHTIDIDQIHPRIDLETLNLYFNEAEVLNQLDVYIENKILNYKTNRDSLENDVIDHGQTSKMSIALKWGLISARTIKNKIQAKFSNEQIKNNESLSHFINELIWREFYKYLLLHYPNLLDTEFQAKFRNTINWDKTENGIETFLAWIKGETGYKLVDACMSQLNNSYWMHNRGRMVVGSILTKNLGIDWHWGQEYFRLMLLDLDEASNNGGWQWSASVGADPKPLRIFNPYLQAQNYDTNNKYTDYWLAKSNYESPFYPIIEHPDARVLALKRYKIEVK